MKGKPKYKLGDEVVFSCEEEMLSGIICTVDKNGTFENPTDVSYDIMVESDKFKTTGNPTGKCLYKHITETLVNG